MIVFLIAIDVLVIAFVGAVYSLVLRESARGRDIVLEMTDYKHLAEDMLPVLRTMLLFAMLFFACLCSLHAGQALLPSQ